MVYFFTNLKSLLSYLVYDQGDTEKGERQFLIVMSTTKTIETLFKRTNTIYSSRVLIQFEEHNPIRPRNQVFFFPFFDLMIKILKQMSLREGCFHLDFTMVHC